MKVLGDTMLQEMRRCAQHDGVKQFELGTVTREYPVAWGVLKRNS